MEEEGTITPYSIRYSDEVPIAAPVMEHNKTVCIPSNGGAFLNVGEEKQPTLIIYDTY